MGKSPTTKGGKFSTNQADAIDYYVSGDGMWINQYFRKDGDGFGELSKNEKQYVKDLDSALNKTVKDKVLYRSVDGSAIFGNDVDFDNLYNSLKYGAGNKYEKESLQKAQAKIGKPITDKGYMSTTRDAQIAEDFGDFTGAAHPIVMRIETSGKTKGADVSKATKNIIAAERSDSQKETLLARGQSYTPMKIYVKNGQIYVDVKMK